MSAKRIIKKVAITTTLALTVSAAGLIGITGSASAATSAQRVEASSFSSLRIGSRSSAVREMQLALIEKGVTVPGGADGIFGPATQGALKSFQQKNGLKSTGILNRRTARKLGLIGGATAAPAAEAPATRINEGVEVRVGQFGEQVRLVQSALILAGINVSGGADGAFGPATYSAVKSFQATKGLAQTGVVDATTAKALNAYFDLAKTVEIKVFPVQGNCGFYDTWHAPRSGGRLHEGVDIIANGGNYLYAANDGVISKITVDNWLSGNALRLTMDNGSYFYYGHLREFAPGIAVGTRVTAGQIIGTVGDTGETTVNHLHFEIHPGGGDPVDPYPFVKAVDNCKSNIVPLQPGLKGLK